MRLRQLSLTAAVGVVVFASCAKKNEVATSSVANVNPQAVQAILIAKSLGESESCEAEVSANGGHVLYRNALGVLFLDKKVSELGLVRCQADLMANETIALAAPQSTKPADNGPDLPTLLRLIPAEEIGARSFVKANPTYDGRGTVVAILDTGVEIDHPMLNKTTTGADKVVDVRDFSGEGRVAMTAAVVDVAGKLSNGYSAVGVTGSDFSFGTFDGESLAYSEDVAGKDKFKNVGILAYKTTEGLRARVDLNDDKDFSNDEVVYDFATSRKFLKLGDKKTLTAALNIAADLKTVSLVFDDGTHGSHVAGIAAGFDANGLQGVAPGAQVISAKIGDSRLSGGSTTTASMMLAIDYAVSKNADVINLSYGIRSGSNLGLSAIDKYVDVVAKEKGTIFSISAGNEGPGLLTIGTPAGANLAITNGAYISARTARDNYGYLGMVDDTIWSFSSVGPRLDGGRKPTLLAPGSALASVPLWAGGHLNYRGTSMASPQTTGGLALLLSAAKQAKLPTDRASITRAVYASAKKVAGLSLIEQGNGLFQVPAALAALAQMKNDLAIEYTLAVSSPTAPGGRGAGIYVRSRQMPVNSFAVTATPSFPVGTSDLEKTKVRTYRLQPTAKWIQVPETIWVAGAARGFQVALDAKILATPGLHSELIAAIDESTGRVAFEVPVTVVSPEVLADGNAHRRTISSSIKVGQTLRYFIEVPPGTTAVQLDLISDGPSVWAQLLNPEGRRVIEALDANRTVPQPPLLRTVSLDRPGVYELDIVAQPTNHRPAQFQAKIQAYSLSLSSEGIQAGGAREVLVQNNFEAVKIVPRVDIRRGRVTRDLQVEGDGTVIPFTLAEAELEALSRIDFAVITSKTYYDLMTDFPFRVFGPKKKLLESGGLEMNSTIPFGELEERGAGNYELEIKGAFTKEAPKQWAFRVVEDRILAEPISVSKGKATLLEPGQFTTLVATLPTIASKTFVKGIEPCATFQLEDPGGRLIQEATYCR